MALIRKGYYTDEQAEYYVFEFPFEKNYSSAASWICKLINSDTFNTEYVILCDKQHEAGAEDLTHILLVPFDEDELASELDDRKSDGIVFTGMLSLGQIYIYLDLKTFEIEVSIHDNQIADYIESNILK